MPRKPRCEITTPTSFKVFHLVQRYVRSGLAIAGKIHIRGSLMSIAEAGFRKSPGVPGINLASTA